MRIYKDTWRYMRTHMGMWGSSAPPSAPYPFRWWCSWTCGRCPCSSSSPGSFLIFLFQNFKRHMSAYTHFFISQNKGRCLPTFSGLSRNTAQISKLFCFLLVDFLKPPFKHLTCVCLLLVDFLKACFKHVKGVRLLCPQQTDSQRVQGGATP